MAEKKCSVDGCDKKRAVKGMCGKHHQRVKRHGDTEIAIHERHGGRTDSEYRTWCSIKERCSNPNYKQFEDYGGRGIKICDRWSESYSAFLSDMGKRPEGKSIDRIDNNGNYEPGNCKWATSKEQQRNKSNNRMLTIYGKTMCLADWHEIVSCDTNYCTIKARLNRRWPDKEAVFGKQSKLTKEKQ